MVFVLCFFCAEMYCKLEKFSRNNRASIQRIKSLSVRLPDKKSEQDKFVQKIEKIDCKIDELHREVKSIDDTINAYFMSVFGDVIEKMQLRLEMQ